MLPLNIFKPSTGTTSKSESMSIQQRDKWEATQVMRFRVGVAFVIGPRITASQQTVQICPENGKIVP